MNYTKPEHFPASAWLKMNDKEKAELCCPELALELAISTGLKIKQSKQHLVKHEKFTTGKNADAGRVYMTDAGDFLKFLRKTDHLMGFIQRYMYRETTLNNFAPDSEYLKLTGQQNQSYDKAKQQVARDKIYRVFARDNPKFRCTCKYQRTCKDGNKGDRCWRLIDSPYGLCNTHKKTLHTTNAKVVMVNEKQFCEMYAKQKPVAFKLMVEAGKYSKFKHLNTIKTQDSVLKTPKLSVAQVKKIQEKPVADHSESESESEQSDSESDDE